MDKDLLEQHLAQAEQHVTLGEAHVAKQQALIEKLERDGLDTITAKQLLATFRDSLREHIADRDRIRDELAGL